MLTAARNFNPAPTRCQPQTENPLAHLLSVATDRSLSCEARLLYVVLCLMAWSKGYCWPSLATLGSYLGRCDDSVSGYHQELQAAGLLVVERSSRRRSNRYWPATLHGQPPKPHNGSGSQPARTRTRSGSNPPTTRMGSGLTPKCTELQNVENVLPPPAPECAPNLETAQNGELCANGNVVSASLPENQEPEPRPLEPAPPGSLVGGPSTNNPQKTLSQSPSQENLSPAPTPEKRPTTTTSKAVSEPKPQPAPFDLPTVLEIESLTGDRRSRGAWVQIVRGCHPETVRQAISATRCKAHEESGVNLGAYFIGCVRNLEPTFHFRKKNGEKPTLTTRPAPAKETPLPPTPVVSPLPKQPEAAKPEPCCLADLDPEEQERRRLLGIRMLGLMRKRLSGELSQAEFEALVAAQGGEEKT